MCLVSYLIGWRRSFLTASLDMKYLSVNQYQGVPKMSLPVFQLEQHRMKRSDAVIPGVGEIVLVVGEQKNRGIWMKGKVLRHIKGRDGIVRGAVLLHKGHEIKRPLELLCPLEIRSAEAGKMVTDARKKFQQEEKTDKVSRPKRVAAKNSQLKTQLLLEEDKLNCKPEWTVW